MIDLPRNLRLLAVLAAVLLSACASKPKERVWTPPPTSVGPQAPQSGRVGVMSLVENKLMHIHAGTTPLGNYETVYPVNYDFGGFVTEELRKTLTTRTPYQPVMVRPTGLLMKHAKTWQDEAGKNGFPEAIQREFDGIIKQNGLVMLIVVSAPPIDDGVSGTSQKLWGSGLYTRSLFGKTSTAVFSTIRFHRLVGTPARLVEPVVAADERSIGDLPDIKLPDDIEGMNVRYLAPVYEPLHHMIRNKIRGLVSLPRKLG